MGKVDTRLYKTIQQTFTAVFTLLQTCSLIVFNVPKMLAALIFMVLMQRKILLEMKPCQKQARRLALISRMP